MRPARSGIAAGDAAHLASMPLSRAAKKLWRKVAQPPRIALHGQRIVARSPDIDAALRRELLRGRYERHKMRQLRNRIEPNDVVLDIGAGIGLAALYAAGMVGAGNVLCVEPDPRAAALARRNFALNRQPIQLTEAAAAPPGAPAQLDFHLNEALGRSSLTPRAGTVATIAVATLDVAPILAERGISALCVDVEGSEHNLLRGIDDFAGVRVILLRINEQALGYGRANDLFQHLFAAGFALDLPDARGRQVALTRHRFPNRPPRDARGADHGAHPPATSDV